MPEVYFDQAMALLPDDAREALRRLELAPRRPTPVTWHDGWAAYLKREYLGPHSTHKTRGLLVQMALDLTDSPKGFSISSSGNAALAAAGLASELGATCLAFLSDKTPMGKVRAAVDTGQPVIVTPKPKNLSRYAARFGKLADLRPSRHVAGSWGYRTLAAELHGQVAGGVSDIFCFCNSGLTLIGLFDGFQALGAPMPALHAVQCSDRADLAEAVGSPVCCEDAPAAGALGARVPPDLDRVAQVVSDSEGAVWMVSNQAVLDAAETTWDEGHDWAIESVAALAGLEAARVAGAVGERPLVVVAGRRWPDSDDAHNTAQYAIRLTEYGEVRALLDEVLP